MLLISNESISCAKILLFRLKTASVNRTMQYNRRTDTRIYILKGWVQCRASVTYTTIVYIQRNECSHAAWPLTLQSTLYSKVHTRAHKNMCTALRQTNTHTRTHTHNCLLVSLAPLVATVVFFRRRTRACHVVRRKVCVHR